ncbi:hypothetical protein Q5P01_022299 [Channa striata]|uniref:Cytidyltransferase-like domain-containing protein n=1 Tax=Channa striata TaxID=64152 RepID=A0AA88IXV2_CHASR|nr:hypothetical protein Q5P01_022299 [Channa striata]
MATRRVPLILLACGSFNPITNQHLRLFELARDHMHCTGQYQVVGGIISPVSDGYGKQGLVLAKHRIAMAKLALQSSSWVTVDEWESQQPDWTETVVTLRHHYGRILKEYEQSTGMYNDCSGKPLPSQAPLPSSNSCVELISSTPLRSLACGRTTTHNIFLVQEWVRNETSATEVRRALRRGLSVKYLIPDSVIEYIHQHNLYTDDSERTNKGKALRPLTKRTHPPVKSLDD